jgi:hypothetical protein
MRELSRLLVDRGAKRRRTAMQLGDDRRDLNEVGRRVEAVAFRANSRRRDRHACTLRDKRRYELAQVHGCALVA